MKEIEIKKYPKRTLFLRQSIATSNNTGVQVDVDQLIPPTSIAVRFNKEEFYCIPVMSFVMLAQAVKDGDKEIKLKLVEEKSNRKGVGGK